jgi:hypothetical protein
MRLKVTKTLVVSLIGCLAISIGSVGAATMPPGAGKPTDRGNAAGADPHRGTKDGSVTIRNPDMAKAMEAKARRDAAIAAFKPGSGGNVNWGAETYAGIKQSDNRKPMLVYIFDPDMSPENKSQAYDMEEGALKEKSTMDALKGWVCIKAESPAEGLSGVDGRTTGAKLILASYDGTIWRRITGAPAPNSLAGNLDFVLAQNNRLLKEKGLEVPAPEKKAPPQKAAEKKKAEEPKKKDEKKKADPKAAEAKKEEKQKKEEEKKLLRDVMLEE